MKTTVFSFYVIASLLLGIVTGGYAQPTNLFRQQFLEYKAKADKGDAASQNIVGVCYANGRGVAKDEKEAVNWIRKASEQNHPEALFNLGVAYENGQGVNVDIYEAKKWYRKAAELNHAGAQNNLGIFHATGQAVKMDPVEAYAWYTLASKTNEEAAKNRDTLAKAMSQQQIADARKRTEELRVMIGAKINGAGR